MKKYYKICECHSILWEQEQSLSPILSLSLSLSLSLPLPSISLVKIEACALTWSSVSVQGVKTQGVSLAVSREIVKYVGK